MPMQLTAAAAPAPYLVSKESSLKNGTTAIWQQTKLLKDGKLALADMAAPDPGFPCGLVSVQVDCSDGVAAIQWTFRAEFDSSGGGGNNGNATADVYELQGSTSQTPITSHPKYEQLYNKYARTERDGEPVWVENDPDGNSGTVGLSSSGGLVSNMSPLYGVKDYAAAQSVYQYTKYYKTRSEIPADLVSKVGKIDAAPEGLSSPGVSGRWLCSGATIRQMGDAFQVTKSWMASQSSKPEGLWKKEIYG
jgi:hypothetical protein